MRLASDSQIGKERYGFTAIGFDRITIKADFW